MDEMVNVKDSRDLVMKLPMSIGSALMMSVLLLVNIRATGQTRQLPEYPKVPMSAGVSQIWEPSSKFLQYNPNFLTTGEFLIEKVSRNEATGEYSSDTIASSKQYSAFFRPSTMNITDLNGGRFIVYLTSIELDFQPNGQEAGEKEINGIKLRALRDNYQSFTETVSNYFSERGITDFVLLPQAGKAISAVTEINPGDILLEFVYVGQDVHFSDYEPTNARYMLNVRDGGTNRVVSVGQICFMDFTKFKASRQFLWAHTLPLRLSIAPAVQSLLNGFFVSNKALERMKRMQSSVIIKASEDQHFMQYVNAQVELVSIQEQQAFIKSELERISNRLKRLGTNGLDLSNIQVNFTVVSSNTSVQLASAVGSAAVSAVGLGFVIAAAAKDSKINRLRRAAEKNFNEFKALQSKATEVVKKMQLLKEEEEKRQSLLAKYGVGHGLENEYTKAPTESHVANAPTASVNSTVRSNARYSEVSSPVITYPSKTTSKAKAENKTVAVDIFSEGVASNADTDFRQVTASSATPSRSAEAPAPVSTQKSIDRTIAATPTSVAVSNPFVSVNCPDFVDRASSFATQFSMAKGNTEKECRALREYALFMVEFRLDDCFEDASITDVEKWSELYDSTKEKLFERKCE